MAERPKVRFGGMMTPEGFLFEITEDQLALDFANTVDERAAEVPRELIGSYSDLVSWSEQVKLVDGRTKKVLLDQAGRDPAEARRALRRAIDLRETIFSLFSGPAGEKDLVKLYALWVETQRHRKLVRRGPAAEWEWQPVGLDQMLWPVVAAAVDLVTSETRDRVRVCGGTVCRWLFIDRSRRRNRRWCDMTTCGNRAKARRHYAKVKGQ